MEGGRWPWRLTAQRLVYSGCWPSCTCIEINFSIFNFRELSTTVLISGATEIGTTLQEGRLGSTHKRPSCQLTGARPSPSLGMRIGHQIKFVVINRHANSLYSLIADGNYRATSLGRITWKSLIGSQASLQPDCNKEGFNAVYSSISHSKARIGILGNNNGICSSCDSRIGFGTGGYSDDYNTCGNEATSRGDNGDKHIKTMGYILVQ